jgi:hypothetical protein
MGRSSRAPYNLSGGNRPCMGHLSRAPSLYNDDDRWPYNLIRRAIVIPMIGNNLIAKKSGEIL